MWISGKMRLLIVSILAIIAVPVYAGTEAEYYVSTEGSDVNPGSLELPFATIEKARDVIRTVNGAMTGDIVVHIKSGRYFVDSTIEFTEVDSGSNGFAIIYKNNNQPGSASFIGGRIVSNWQLYQGQIYYADVGSVDFHTLYENGKRARKARTPNYEHSEKHPVAQANYLRGAGVNGSRTVLQYGSGDLDPAGWDIDDAQVYIWPGGKWAWFTDTTPIDSIDTSTRTITLKEQTRYPIYQSGKGSRYFVQGVLELLDEPGEFHYDSSAGRLYYWPMDGVMSQQEIIVPTVKRIVSLVGSDDSHVVSNLRFEGLRFEVSDFTGWYRHAYPNAGDSGEVHQYSQYDRQISMPQHRTGMIYLENTRQLTFKDCVVRNAGYSGIYCHGYNQGNRFEGNWISHTGQSGIFFEGRYPGEGNVLKNNVITNCVIHDIGELAGQAGAVNIMNSGDNEVSYCDIYNGSRYAVLIAAYVDIPFGDIYAYGNKVKYLNIHDCCQDSGDTAPIYIWGASDDSPYHKNYFEQIRIDNISAHPSMPDIAPNGVFMDNDAHGQSFTNIHVTRTQGGQFRTNDSSSHVFSNVSWRSGFDEQLMEPDKIGINSSYLYPVTVGGLDYTYDKTGVTLTWDEVKNAASYSVFRAEDSEGSYEKIADSVEGASYKDTDAEAETMYYYKIASVTNSDMASDLSASLSVFYSFTPFSEGFEIGFERWEAGKGQPSRSSSVFHEGQYSYEMNEDMDVIHHDMVQQHNGLVTIWFYDDALDSSVQCFARVDSGLWDDSYSWVGIGVAGSVSSSHYVKRIGANTSVTEVARSTGWHKFQWDYSSRNNVIIFIDDTQVGQTELASSFRYIALGDWWGDNRKGQVYFDEIEVVPTFQTDFNKDGKVDIEDIMLLAAGWLQSGLVSGR